MFYVYVLRSEKNGRRYIGFTQQFVEERLKEHNAGLSDFTSRNRPYKLLYFEKYEDKDFALKRERFLKSGQGRSFLNRKLSALSRQKALASPP